MANAQERADEVLEKLIQAIGERYRNYMQSAFDIGRAAGIIEGIKRCEAAFKGTKK